MSERLPAFGAVFILGAAVAAVVVLAAIALLAWSRYLSHKETVRLYERSGDLTPLLEERARWRARAGRTYGIRVLIVGLVLLLLGWDWAGHNSAAGPVLLAALLLVAVGITTMVSHARWAQEEEDRAHPPTQEELARREGRRLRRGVMIGVVVQGAGIVLVALCGGYAVLGETRGYREELGPVISLNDLELMALAVLGLVLAAVGWGLIVGYAVARRGWRRRGGRPL